MRKLMFIMSKKYPEFYNRERKHIITNVSIILASILMRIIEHGLFSIDTVREELKDSYKN
jgi:hypothetical protein